MAAMVANAMLVARHAQDPTRSASLTMSRAEVKTTKKVPKNSAKYVAKGSTYSESCMGLLSMLRYQIQVRGGFPEAVGQRKQRMPTKWYQNGKT
mmetsp:Transcript_5962/g.13979  ORF Transcript_5962/g.13979 Transcript_5962/m.13979 type:complete len:94 (-) Transcript_5962:2-283(-)